MVQTAGSGGAFPLGGPGVSGSGDHFGHSRPGVPGRLGVLPSDPPSGTGGCLGLWSRPVSILTIPTDGPGDPETRCMGGAPVSVWLSGHPWVAARARGPPVGRILSQEGRRFGGEARRGRRKSTYRGATRGQQGSGRQPEALSPEVRGRGGPCLLGRASPYEGRQAVRSCGRGVRQEPTPPTWEIGGGPGPACGNRVPLSVGTIRCPPVADPQGSSGAGRVLVPTARGRCAVRRPRVSPSPTPWIG